MSFPDPNNHRGRRQTGRRGFTLIEAIIAIVIVSTALPATLVFMSDAQTRRAGPILAGRARWLAGEKLEDIIADRHSGTRGWSYIASNNYPAEPSISGFAGFSRSVSISETGASLTGGGTGYRTVTVTVGWMDPVRGATSLSLATVLTDFTP